MTADLLWDAPMTEEEDKPRAAAGPPAALANNPWTPILAPVVVTIIGVALVMWQTSAVAGAEQAQLKADVAALEIRFAAMERQALTLEAEQRNNAAQLASIKDAVNEIKNYHGATMKEVRDLGLKFAKIEGSMGKKDE